MRIRFDKLCLITQSTHFIDKCLEISNLWSVAGQPTNTKQTSASEHPIKINQRDIDVARLFLC